MMNQDKPSLEHLAPEIQLDILRYLFFDHDTVKFGPLQEHERGEPKRSLSILRVSERLSTLALSVLYGETFFVISENCISYYRNSLGPTNGPKDTRTVLFTEHTGGDWVTMLPLAKSVHCLDKLSYQTPAQNMLKRLSITASREMMRHFYDYALIVPLIRMRGLQLLHFTFKEGEQGNGLRYLENEGEGPESNGRRFMKLVDWELAHVKEVVVEDSTVVNFSTDYGVALLRVIADLGDRNRPWGPPEEMVQAFWGGVVGKDGGF